VELHGDGNTDENAVVPQRVEIELRDGTKLDQRVDAALGSPENPLPRAAQIAKVRACFNGIMPEGRAEALMQAIDALHQAPDAAAALKLY
jgi:hypothetical protein